MFKKTILSVLLFGTLVAYSQVGIGTTTPTPGSILDIESTDKGLLIPRVALTATNLPAPITPAPVEGMMIYNTVTAGTSPNIVTPGFYFWDGSIWTRVATGGAVTADWSLSGNGDTTPGTNFLGTTNNAPLRFRTVNTLTFEISGGNAANRGKLRSFTLGTAALPVYSWTNDTDTGIFRPADDNIAFSTGGTERLRIDANGNVGVNTIAPAHKFHVSNNSDDIGSTALANSENTGSNGVALSGINNNATNGFNGLEGGTSYNLSTSLTAAIFGLAVANTGNGIGTRGHSNSWQGVGVRGSRTNSGGPNTGWGGVFYGDLGYTGFFGLASDLRLKEDINPLLNATDILKKLKPVTYHYNTEKYKSLGFNEGIEYGLIAQEVREILPTLVKEKSLFIKSKSGVSELNTTEEGTSQNFLMIDYTRLTPILIQAVKEQQEIIENQESRIAKLEALVNQLGNKN